MPPNQPATPTHSVRIPDAIWDAVRRLAESRGETATDVVLDALKRYLREFD